MSGFIDSLRTEEDGELENFVYELFERVESLHDEAKTEIEQAYHQGEKDALRRVMAFMKNSDIDLIIGSSVIAYKLRGDIPLDDGTFIKK